MQNLIQKFKIWSRSQKIVQEIQNLIQWANIKSRYFQRSRNKVINFCFFNRILMILILFSIWISKSNFVPENKMRAIFGRIWIDLLNLEWLYGALGIEVPGARPRCQKLKSLPQTRSGTHRDPRLKPADFKRLK